MDDSAAEHGHRHRHRHKRVRRRSGLGAEDYLLFALALVIGVLVMGGILWFINRPKLW